MYPHTLGSYLYFCILWSSTATTGWVDRFHTVIEGSFSSIERILKWMFKTLQAALNSWDGYTSVMSIWGSRSFRFNPLFLRGFGLVSGSIIINQKHLQSVWFQCNIAWLFNRSLWYFVVKGFTRFVIFLSTTNWNTVPKGNDSWKDKQNQPSCQPPVHCYLCSHEEQGNTDRFILPNGLHIFFHDDFK